MERKICIDILGVGLLLLFMIENSKSIREFGFQKEHDGSLIGFEGPIPKINLAGKIIFLEIRSSDKILSYFEY